MNEIVVVVLVTFNRLDKLRISLECYEKQEYPLERIIVVDNCSSDGTVEFLKEWQTEAGAFRRDVLYLKENTGGAGGFGSGMEYVLKRMDEGVLDADWILVSDDDAFPEPDAVKQLIYYYNRQTPEVQKGIAALSSSVINKGEIHESHRSRIQKSVLRVRFVGVSKEEYKKEAFDIDLFSYVGTMIKISAIRKAGTTNKALFIYGDDNEHSIRLSKTGRLVVVSASRYIHDTPGVETRSVGWHNYYNRRNQLYILKKYFPKRYFYSRMIKRIILDESPVSKYTKEERRLFKTARLDAMSERLGKHSKYRPGFHV